MSRLPTDKMIADAEFVRDVIEGGAHGGISLATAEDLVCHVKALADENERLRRSQGGEPAFPCEVTYSDGEVHGVQTSPHSGIATGVSVRDYFAAKAMVRCMPYELLEPGMRVNNVLTREVQLRRVSRDAYAMADAMLEARGGQ